VLKLAAKHPVKRWFEWVSKSPRPGKEDQQKMDVLSEIINSQFNLITDQKSRAAIIDILTDIPSDTLGEKLLTSFLYLMIGNVTRSDNILVSIIHEPPRVNWKGFSTEFSIYHKLSVANLERILSKFSNHPTDRRRFQLFAQYLRSFTNEAGSLNYLQNIDVEDLQDTLHLSYVEKISPAFVHYLRLMEMNETRRVKNLRKSELFPLTEQAYWVWPFLEINPFISEKIMNELKRLEKEDQLWFIYLMENEKLADLFTTKMEKSFISSSRQFLRAKLDDRESFMMSLYKLIQMGDIDESLIEKTVNFLVDE
jgi:hypothetical protein